MITLACLDMAGTTVADGGAVEKSFVEAMVQSGVADGTDQMSGALDFVRASMGQSKITVFRHLFGGDETQAMRANDAFEAAYAVGRRSWRDRAHARGGRRVHRDARDGDQGLPHDRLRATYV